MHPVSTQASLLVESNSLPAFRASTTLRTRTQFTSSSYKSRTRRGWPATFNRVGNNGISGTNSAWVSQGPRLRCGQYLQSPRNYHGETSTDIQSQLQVAHPSHRLTHCHINGPGLIRRSRNSYYRSRTSVCSAKGYTPERQTQEAGYSGPTTRQHHGPEWHRSTSGNQPTVQANSKYGLEPTATSNSCFRSIELSTRQLKGPTTRHS